MWLRNAAPKTLEWEKNTRNTPFLDYLYRPDPDLQYRRWPAVAAGLSPSGDRPRGKGGHVSPAGICCLALAIISILGFPSIAGSSSEYGDIIKETPEYELIITPRNDADDDDDDRHHHHYHRYHRHYDHVYSTDYPPPRSYSRSSRTGGIGRGGALYVGVTIGESEFDYDDIDNGDASIIRIGYRLDDSRLGYELSIFDSGTAEVTSLTDIDLQVDSVNLALTVNSSRNSRSTLNLFAQGGIYFADTTLSGPFDSVSENSNGFLLAAGIEVMLNRNFSIKAEAFNLIDVEDFANDESISILNVGGQFIF